MDSRSPLGCRIHVWRDFRPSLDERMAQPRPNPVRIGAGAAADPKELALDRNRLSARPGVCGGAGIGPALRPLISGRDAAGRRSSVEFGSPFILSAIPQLG